MKDHLVTGLGVDCNRIPRFVVFVANDMCGSVTIFGC
jgi:hypothetical protein